MMKHQSASFYLLLFTLLTQSQLCDALLAPSPLRLTASYYHSRSTCARLSNGKSWGSKPRNHVSPIFLRSSSEDINGHSSSDEVNGKASSSNVAPKSQTPAEIPISLTVATGILTSLLGYIYSQCMKRGFRLLWKTFPAFLLGSTTGAASSNPLIKFVTKYPPLYIVGMTTLGGSTVAYLSSYFDKMYSAHDYVHILSCEEIDNGEVGDKDIFPSAMYILPVMGLCLITSLSGFSLGPEAPMVSFSLFNSSIVSWVHLMIRISKIFSSKPETIGCLLIKQIAGNSGLTRRRIPCTKILQA
jgi:hypothetical protein